MILEIFRFVTEQKKIKLFLLITNNTHYFELGCLLHPWMRYIFFQLVKLAHWLRAYKEVKQWKGALCTLRPRALLTC